jgi:putative transferase (TIGR04331 family)
MTAESLARTNPAVTDSKAVMGKSPVRTARLYVGTADANFRRGHDMALGPWCFIGCETDDLSAEDQSYPFIFETADQLYASAKSAQLLARGIADRLVDDLNRRHGTAYSPRYWHHMTLPWIIHLVQLTVSYYTYIGKFIAEHGDRDFHCVIASDRFRLSYPDTQTFLHLGVRDKTFGAWVSSLVMREIAPPNWTLEPALALSPPFNEARAAIVAPRRHSFMGTTFRRFLPRLRVDHVAGTKISRLLFHIWLSILPVPRRARAAVPDGALMSVASIDDCPAALKRILDQLVDATMPLTLTDGYAALETAASRIPYRPGRLLVGSLPLYDDGQRIVAARAEEAGEKIVPSQHGGSYGLCKAHPDVFELEYGRKRFLTWGWEEQESEQQECRFYPVPAPGLCKVRDTYRRTNNTLILTGCRITSVPWRLCAIPRAAQWIDYRRAKLAFLGGLDDDVRDNLVYRPYLKDEEDLSDSRYVQERFPDTRLLPGVLEPSLLSCRLLVLDYPGSTLNFAMAANVPTVCFWDPDAWPESIQGKVFFDRFRALGMLHDSPEDAARHINEIWGDVDTWWQSDAVQATRRDFCRRYARTSRIWWWHWLKTLTRIHFER